MLHLPHPDDDGLFGSLDYRPAGIHAPDALREIWSWDSGAYVGTIPEANETYNVVGNVNEFGVIITETTFGGLNQLSGGGVPGQIIDYGELIWITLSRAKTAREAIALMDSLTQTYGYSSSGESFGVGDSNEVWLLEMIGKGTYAKGTVWVASRIPEGYVGSTANQARTQTFVQDDPNNVLFSADVISFARSIGVYNGTDADFNFREAYDPISFSGARYCEARVWNVMNPACGGCLDGNLDFAQGYNLSNSMPLFVPAASKLNVSDVMTLMRTHGEGTWFDNTGIVRPDVGAGAGNSPYRERPLSWTYNGSTYLNERTVGVQQTGFSFIATSRGWLPAPIQAVSWFAPDDSSTSPHIATYGGATRIPPSYGSIYGNTPSGAVAYAPTADSWHMNLQSAFWIYNLVGNECWGERWQTALPLVVDSALSLQSELMASAAAMEAQFVASYDPSNPAPAIEMMTSFMENAGEDALETWRDFWMVLFATVRDGGILSAPPVPACSGGATVNCTCRPIPNSDEVGYSEDWRGRIVGDSDNAQRYLIPPSAGSDAAAAAVSVADKAAIATRKRRGAAGQRRA
jgi:dipeptidase